MTEHENPYLAARRTWNDHVGRLVAARSMWQAVGLTSLLIALACVAGLLHLSGRSRFVPYVIEVDGAGRARAVGAADAAPPATRVAIENQLTTFITLARRVTTDIALQRSAIFGVYAMLAADDPATTKMTDYLSGNAERTPFRRAAVETVSTEITSVLQQTAETWQVEWTERVFARSGSLKAETPMQALVHVYQSDTRFSTEEMLRENPLGIYVRDFTWNENRRREVSR